MSLMKKTLVYAKEKQTVFTMPCGGGLLLLAWNWISCTLLCIRCKIPTLVGTQVVRKPLSLSWQSAGYHHRYNDLEIRIHILQTAPLKTEEEAKMTLSAKNTAHSLPNVDGKYRGLIRFAGSSTGSMINAQIRRFVKIHFWFSPLSTHSTCLP